MTIAMATEEGASLPLYRPTKAIPYELVQHCGIFLEEKLCWFARSHTFYATH